MATNLDYLNPDLQPLVQKVEQYLQAKDDLRKQLIAERNEPLHEAEMATVAAEVDVRPATGSYDQHADELAQNRENLQDDLRYLAAEVLALLPVRDEWVKLNLGYGPSRVGAWRVPGAQGEQYEIRVVV